MNLVIETNIAGGALMTSPIGNDFSGNRVQVYRWLLLLVVLSLSLGCFPVGNPSGFATGAGQKFGGVNDNGHFFTVTLINNCIPVGDKRPGVFYGLFRFRPEGQSEPKWSVPWVIIDEVMPESDSFGWPSSSGASKTEPFRFELSQTFEYDQGNCDFSWSADCSGTVPEIATFMFNNKPVDLAQGSLFILTLDADRQVVVTQRKWKGDFQQLSLSGTGDSPPAIGDLGESISIELGY